MAIRIKWDKYETALLIDGFWKIEKSLGERKAIIDDLSKVLRTRAINLGMQIDEVFRNVNGISMQLAPIAHAFFPERPTLTTSAMFTEMVNLYKSDRKAFEEILCVARKQAEGDEVMVDTKDNRNSFITWLSSNCPKGLSSRDVLSSIENGSKMCLKYQFSDKSFWKMSSVDEYSNVTDRLLAALKMSSFVITQSILFERIKTSIGLYKAYLIDKIDTQRSKEKVSTIESKPVAAIQKEKPVQKSKRKEPVKEDNIIIDNNVMSVLKMHYKYGFNIDSPIEMLRFRAYYESVYNIQYKRDDDALKSDISHCGLLYNGKIYVVNQEIESRIKTLILNRIQSGDELFYYEEIYSRNEEWLSDGYIIDPELLRILIESIFPRFRYRDKYFLANATRTNEINALKETILYFWGNKQLRSLAELKSLLPYIPMEKIRYALASCKEFIWNSSETYARADLFVVSDEQITKLIDVAEEKCEENGKVFFNELPLEEIESENYELTETAIHAIVFTYLPDSFVRNGKVISRRSDQQQDAYTAIQDYCKKHETCTMRDLEQVMQNAVGAVRYPAIIEAANSVMVRVSQDDFVSDDCVRFDALGIDSALDKVVLGSGIGIKEVTTFGIFPFCGYSWNYFVLESYCRRFSARYRYACITPNSQNVGAIVRKRSTLSYHDIMAEALARSEIKLVEQDAFDYLVASGYLVQRRYGDMDALLKKALVLREGGS